jgi:hypothetical protein
LQMIDHIPRIRENTLGEERKRVYANSSATDFKAEIVVPGMHCKRTPEEMEQLRREAECERVEHYRDVYTKLGLRAVAHKDGTLELTWRAERGLAKYALHQDARQWQ